MFRTTSRTLLRAGFALAVLCSWPLGASIAQTVCAAASVSPASVAAGTSPTMTVTTNGTIDLGNVTTQQFGIKPNLGITNIKILGQTAQDLRFSTDIASSATPGTRTLFVNDASGHEVVALNLEITPSAPPCGGPCPNGLVCVTGLGCVEPCNNKSCPPDRGSCVNGRCVPH